MIDPLTFGAAMIRMSGDAWAQQLRLMGVCQRAALEQMQIAWGMRAPRPPGGTRAGPERSARPRAVPRPPRRRPVRPDPAEQDNLPV